MGGSHSLSVVQSVFEVPQVGTMIGDSGLTKVLPAT